MYILREKCECFVGRRYRPIRATEKFQCLELSNEITRFSLWNTIPNDCVRLRYSKGGCSYYPAGVNCGENCVGLVSLKLTGCRDRKKQTGRDTEARSLSQMTC
jgi:hypothetical protein